MAFYFTQLYGLYLWVLLFSCFVIKINYFNNDVYKIEIGGMNKK